MGEPPGKLHDGAKVKLDKERSHCQRGVNGYSKGSSAAPALTQPPTSIEQFNPERL